MNESRMRMHIVCIEALLFLPSRSTRCGAVQVGMCVYIIIEFVSVHTTS